MSADYMRATEDGDVVRPAWNPTPEQYGAYVRREVELARENLRVCVYVNGRPNVGVKPPPGIDYARDACRTVRWNGLQPGQGMCLIGVKRGTVQSPADLACSAFTLARAMTA